MLSEKNKRSPKLKSKVPTSPLGRQRSQTASSLDDVSVCKESSHTAILQSLCSNIAEITVETSDNIHSLDFEENCLQHPIVILRNFLRHPDVLFPENGCTFGHQNLEELYGNQSILVMTQVRVVAIPGLYICI